MADEPQISVIIPAYQAADYILRTIEAVASQTQRSTEVVVVDDGSTDDTPSVVENFAGKAPSFPLRLVRETHRGPGATRNSGIRAAEAEWVAFLDADDLWHPEKIEVVSKAIRAHPEANFFCHNETIRELDHSYSTSDYSAGFNPGLSVTTQLYERNRFSTSAVVCRRSLLLESGGFDETLSSAQDYELWLRLSPEMIPIFIPEVLGTYIMRRGNISTSRYWLRLLNLLRVRHRHRRRVSRSVFIHAQCLAIAAHLMSPGVRRLARRVLGRRGR
jgi:glycosyltransferase involved in cell wall biosynthesis